MIDLYFLTGISTSEKSDFMTGVRIMKDAAYYFSVLINYFVRHVARQNDIAHIAALDRLPAVTK